MSAIQLGQCGKVTPSPKPPPKKKAFQERHLHETWRWESTMKLWVFLYCFVLFFNITASKFEKINRNSLTYWETCEKWVNIILKSFWSKTDNKTKPVPLLKKHPIFFQSQCIKRQIFFLIYYHKFWNNLWMMKTTKLATKRSLPTLLQNFCLILQWF